MIEQMKHADELRVLAHVDPRPTPHHIFHVPQLDLFADGRSDRPTGMAYAPDFLSAEEEGDLIEMIAGLPFAPFYFHGHHGLRRVVRYGWLYDFTAGKGMRVEPIPEWLWPLRNKAGAWAGLDPALLEQALLTEYRPEAPIGWHRDRPMFDAVIGVSLGASCVLRFRRRSGPGWERKAVPIAPRSIYRLGGDSRRVWEHSIAPAKALRYSATFRSLSEPQEPSSLAIR